MKLQAVFDNTSPLCSDVFVSFLIFLSFLSVFYFFFIFIFLNDLHVMSALSFWSSLC